MKHSSETLGVGVFYHGCLAVIKNPDIQHLKKGGQSRVRYRQTAEI
jgi:hypothetical protein